MNRFFNESRDQSKVKSAIVSKYFDAWAQVMIGVQDRYNRQRGSKIAYIDLFAGPGRYEDGTVSTPVLILQKAIGNEKMRQRLVTIFNDKDEANTNSLEKAISEIPGIEQLKFQPEVKTQEVGDNIAKMFEKMRLIPTLFFVDPWGYKGLSLRLVNSVLKDWGCDCIFFFNYNRTNMGLNNAAVQEHMDALFGQDRAASPRQRIERNSSIDRELFIVEELCQALKDMGPQYVLPFRFRDELGTRTSHHLIFVSKGFKGYEIMKHIMAKECTSEEQGVPSFEYNPVDQKQSDFLQLLLEFSRPLDDLKEMLLVQYSGSTKAMKDIYEEHSVGRRFIRRNYVDVLQALLAENKITTDRKPRRGTFADNIMVTFSQIQKATE